jgi:hypothetical protein
MINITTEKKIRPSTKESLLLPIGSGEKPLTIVTSNNNEAAIPTLRLKREVSEFSPLRKFIVEQKQLYPVFLINKYVQYYQSVPFSEIYSEILGLSTQIDNLSPSGPENFTVLLGTKNTYWLSKHPFIGGLGTVACASISTAQVDLYTLQHEKLQVPEPVILSDKMIWDKNRLTCLLHRTNYADLNCISSVKIWATATNLNFTTLRDKDLYLRLTEHNEKTIWHLMTNGTHLWLEKRPLAKIICLAPNATTNEKFSNVVKSKYFAHLAHMCTAIANSFSNRVQALERMFLTLAGVHPTEIDNIQKSPHDFLNNIRELFNPIFPS